MNHVERQTVMLLRALHWIYLPLGAFAAATLVTLLGGVAGQLPTTPGNDNVPSSVPRAAWRISFESMPKD